MDRYTRVEKPREETPIKENEIRIMTQGRMRNYITYAINLLQEKGANEIVFKAMGRAINKTVMIVELIKRRVVGLHQNTSIGSIDITDTWEPLEEGLLPLETTRHVSMVTITLAKVELDTSAIGYQTPLPADQVRPLVEYEYDEEGAPSGRGRGFGGRGRGRGHGNNGMMEYGDGRYENRGPRGGYGNGYTPRGRGGRGGGFRGRGRRGGGYGGPRPDYGGPRPDYSGPRPDYGGPRPDYQQDGPGGGFYDNAPMPPQGRGRGRGRGHGRGQGRGGGRGRDYPKMNGFNAPNVSNGPINEAA